VAAFYWTVPAPEIIALQERDRVQPQYKSYREYCVLMGFGLSRAIASTGNGLDDFGFPRGGLH
jgi:hypothetical protein